MAIAPSKLGELIAREWHSDEALVIDRLRSAGLVEARASDADIGDAIRRARDEHSNLPEGLREYNSPHERVRVFLAPFLTQEGKAWAIPLAFNYLEANNRSYPDRLPRWRQWIKDIMGRRA